MKKILLIVRSNLRKSKGQTAAITVLILLASCMLNLWLMLATDYKQNFDRCHDRLNAEHITLVITGDDPEMLSFLSRTLDQDPRTLAYRIDGCMSMVGSFEYNGGEVNTTFVILEKENALNRSIGRIEIVEESGLESGIYLPILYGMDGGTVPGDSMDITIGNSTLEFPLCGYTNSAMTGSHNCSMAALVLTADRYASLSETGNVPGATLVSIRIKDKSESQAYEAMLKNTLSALYPDRRMLSNSYELVSSSRYISQMICAGIVSAMAFFILVIALVVIVSNVIHYIQSNMQKLGALKAIGYTSGQLIHALLLQFWGITLLSAAAGAGLSYCLFPAVNSMMASQTGIPYALHFLPLPFAAAAGGTSGAVALCVWLSARRIKKTDPVMALRQGVSTHSFKHNHVPLEDCRIPLLAALALKTTLSGKKQNITVCITMLALSLVVVFSGLMLENMILDMDPFINMIVGETADSCININAGAEQDLLRLLEEDSCVEKNYLFHTAEVRHEGSIALMATICNDYSLVNNQQMCIQGRYPNFDNEVALGAKYAKEAGFDVGDEIILTADGESAAYLICGLVQITNNLGQDCLLTRDGYRRMGEPSDLSYYINVKAGTDIDGFNERICGKLGKGANASINILSVMEGSSSVYVSMMTSIVFAILGLSIIIIAFVLYLLVRTLLNTKKLDYGIQKALGFTTGQLVLQTALNFMPALVFSTALGLVLCSLVINPLTALFLNGIGIMKCTFTIPGGFIAAAGAGLVLLAFGIACLLSLKIRRISPNTMLQGD